MSESKKQIWGNRTSVKPSEDNIKYCAGRDVSAKKMADEILIPYDIWNNQAHCLMLHQQKILSEDKLASILKALDKALKLNQKAKFILAPEYEDVHMNIEKFVTEETGIDAGGYMHTARSRNDQSATDMRLYMRDELLELLKGGIDLVKSILELAKKHTTTVMPGFTHHQLATVTTFGHWLASYAQAIIRDLERFVFSYDIMNINPLGAAAAFGTPWNIDRELTTQYLGFDHVQENSLDCITSRWEMETQSATAVSFFMTHLSIISEDILFLSSGAYPMLIIDDRYVTGSSIMPQKRNPDFAEVTKAKTALVNGMSQSLWGIAKAMMSGYNRDTQWTKYIIMDIFDEVRLASKIFSGVFDTIKINENVMFRLSNQKFANASIIADYMASTRKIAFRVAYNAIAKAVNLCEKEGILSYSIVNKVFKEIENCSPISKKEWENLSDPLKMIEQRKHTGGPAPESVMTNIKNLSGKIEGIYKEYAKREQKLTKAKENLNSVIKKHIKK